MNRLTVRWFGIDDAFRLLYGYYGSPDPRTGARGWLDSASMGLAYRSDETTRLTVSVVDGEVTPEDFHEHARIQGEDPKWHTTTRSLTDARTAVLPTAPPEEQLHGFAELYAKMRASDQSFRAAIIAPHDFWVARRYGDMRTDSRSETVVFNDLAPACLWLGIDLADATATIAELRLELG